MNIPYKALGKANVSIKSAIVGKHYNIKISYRPGIYGIDESGSIKILFRIVSDVGIPQTKDPNKPNFLIVKSSKKTCLPKVGIVSGGLVGKIHERPWSKGFQINITNDYLSSNDYLCIELRNWRMQTFWEKAFKIKIAVDPFATGKYTYLPKDLKIKLKPDTPQKIKIITQTIGLPNKKLKGIIKLEDKWGNPCYNLNTSASVFLPERNYAQKVKITNGVGEFSFKIKNIGNYYITGKYQDLETTSNPIVIRRHVFYKYLWADLHGQTEETVGTNDINHYFNFAKKYSFLQVSSIQGNDFQVEDIFWEKINSLTNSISKENEFIAFPGYEWSGNTAVGGDRNIIFKNSGFKLYRSSKALIENQTIYQNAETVKKLFTKFKRFKNNVLIIPHVGGRYADLTKHSDDLEQLIEIHSDWGTFEWFLEQAMQLKYKVGFVANSDGHTGRPGSSYPTFAHFNTYGGLTCILSQKFTREAIFKALKMRRTYATTGHRPFVKFKMLIDKTVLNIGDIYNNTQLPTTGEIEIEYVGNSHIEVIEIFNRLKLVKRFLPNTVSSKKGKYILVMWQGAKNKGRNKAYVWKGKIELKNSSLIDKVRKINFYNQNNKVISSDNKIKFIGLTTGGLQGLIFGVTSSENAVVSFTINNKTKRLKLSEITNTPININFSGIDSKVLIKQTSSNNVPLSIFHNKFPIKLNSKFNAIYAKILQQDGNVTYTSPIYLTTN